MRALTLFFSSNRNCYRCDNVSLSLNSTSVFTVTVTSGIVLLSREILHVGISSVPATLIEWWNSTQRGIHRVLLVHRFRPISCTHQAHFTGRHWPIQFGTVAFLVRVFAFVTHTSCLQKCSVPPELVQCASGSISFSHPQPRYAAAVTGHTVGTACRSKVTVTFRVISPVCLRAAASAFKIWSCASPEL